MKKIIFLLLIMAVSSRLYSENTIEISVDLGGNKFHYLELLYAKIIVKNKGTQPLELKKGDIYSGPYAVFEIFDKQTNKTLPNMSPMSGSYEGEITFYVISSGAQIEFPLGSYYSLKDYMYPSSDFIYTYLKPGKYKVRVTIWLKNKKIASDWLDFEVTNDQYAGLQQFLNIGRKYKDLRREFKEIEKEYYQILEYDSVSMLSLRVIYSFPFLYNYFYDGSKEYLSKKQFSLLKNAENLCINHFPESRFAYQAVAKLAGYLRSDYYGSFAFDFIELMENFQKRIKRPEIRKVFENKIRLGKKEFSQSGLQIIKRKTN